MTAETRSLRILLALKHAGYVGVYASLVRELAARGHSVHVVCLGTDGDGHGTLDRLCAHPRVSSAPAAHRGVLDGWSSAAWLVRALGDLGRYSDPRFAEASALRDRMAAKVQSHLSSAAGFDPLTRRLARRRARQLHARTSRELAERAIRTSSRLEATIGPSRRVTASLRAEAPDVVLVSPLIDLASPLLEYLKAARRLRIPTGICVASWDNLTGKGLLRFAPDRVFVWNDIQRGELAEMHGIAPDSVVLTGAQRFDEWFERRPAAERDELVRKVGLDPAHPYILYLCSSPFIAPDEVGFVRRWAAALRDSGVPTLQKAGILVRPHPQNARQWADADLSGFGDAAVWPRAGAQPDAGEARADYFDSLAHSGCVVGINTSGLIEAAIVGKSVLTVLDPSFSGTQDGTLHFQYLRWENGGPLHVAADLDEHLTHLQRALAHGPDDLRQIKAFVERFCRPQGLDRAAAPRLAAAIEELGRLGPLPRARPAAGTIARRSALYPLAATITTASNAVGALRWVRKRLLGAVRRG
jgi:hypothetical protein